MRLSIALILFAASLSASAASSSGDVNYYTGNTLNADPLSSHHQVDLAILRGYVAAVHDIFNNKLFCVPDDVPLNQVTAVTMRYLSDHPTKWNESGKLLVANALKDSYPCKKK